MFGDTGAFILVFRTRTVFGGNSDYSSGAYNKTEALLCRPDRKDRCACPVCSNGQRVEGKVL